MSESRHTPGPLGTIETRDGWDVADRMGRPTARQCSHEDARLYAAAPALVAALDWLVKTADSAAETGHTEAEVIAGNWDVLGPRARAALALARGDAPRSEAG